MKSSLHKQGDFAGGQSLLFMLFALFKAQPFLTEILFALEILIQYWFPITRISPYSHQGHRLKGGREDFY